MAALHDKTLHQDLATKYPKAGVWIDHTKAEVVVLRGDEVDIKTVYSNVESKHRAMGGSYSSNISSHMGSVSELKMHEKRENELKRFYEDVTEELRHAHQFFITGPDGAKNELKNVLSHHPDVLKKMVAMETSAKLTEPQLISQVKHFFQH